MSKGREMSRRPSQRFRAGPFVLVVLAVAAACAACVWGSDTLRQEAKGAPGVVDVIVGRFDRNPPLYYEMRLARVAALLEAEPEDLGAYDDAGVACDRLGRHDEAIAWMERKRAQLDHQHDAHGADESAGDLAEHEYRYLAKLGTFLAHRWVARGADREALDDLRQGRDHIARAIELNPDAHFGRERYQLLFMDWMMAPPDFPHAEYEAPHIFTELFFRGSRTKPLAAPDDDDAVEGLSGLVALGAAWESVDAFIALGVVLGQHWHASLGELAKLRALELIDSGARSMHPQAPSEAETMKWAASSAIDRATPQGASDREGIAKFFEEARASADDRHVARTAYMMARLGRGEHPDTHDDFWDGWVEPAAPKLPGGLLNNDQERMLMQATAIGAVVILLPVAIALRVRRGRRAALAQTLPI